jgi:hypothetical protein
MAQSGVGSVCKDGTKDTHVGRGACSRHGGVDKDATAKAAKAVADSVKAAKLAAAKTARANAKTSASAALNNAKTAASTSASASASTSSGASVNNDATGATAKCKDGSYSHAKTHQGACSRHGGVAQWLKS